MRCTCDPRMQRKVTVLFTLNSGSSQISETTRRSDPAYGLSELILIELLGGIAALIRAFFFLASVPMAAVLLVAMFSVLTIRASVLLS